MNIVRRVMGAFGYVKRGAAYIGATVSRLTSDWIMAGTGSADQTISGDFYRLRARAREQIRNNPLAARLVELHRTNVIGSQGITLQSRVTLPGGTLPDTKARQELEAAWREWSRKENCTVDGRLSFRDVQALAVESRVADGEALVRLHRGRGKFGLQLELLDADQLAGDHRREARPGVNAIRYGVEVDSYGRPVAYHIHRHHPSESSVVTGPRQLIRVPADQILHLYKSRRPGQTRGVTEIAPGMLHLKMLDGLLEAELVATRTAATKMGFFTRDPSASLGLPSTGAPAKVAMEAEPGLVDFLPHGAAGFEAWDPQHPTTAFSPFIQVVQRHIASGWGVTYHSLTGDLSGVNYTSSRTGMLSERDTWRTEQTWMTDHFLEPVFSAWLSMATLAGQIRPPRRDSREWSAHTWIPRGWDWTDPLKDLAADEIAIRLGIKSRSEIAAARGSDLAEVFDNLAAEKALAEAKGLELTVSDTGASISLYPDAKGPADG